MSVPVVVGLVSLVVTSARARSLLDSSSSLRERMSRAGRRYSNMSEQFWYTWSTAGFGITSAGFRVRAASNGFMNARGLVDMQSERLLTLRQHLNYDLPQDTLDPYKIDVRQAPRSLAFVQAGSERILVNTTYTGLDVVKRAGNFFSHLLTELPPVPSPCPG